LVDSARKLDELLTLYPAVQNFIRRNNFTFKAADDFNDIARTKLSPNYSVISISLHSRFYDNYDYFVEYQTANIANKNYMIYKYSEVSQYAMSHEFGHLVQATIIDFYRQYSLEWLDIKIEAQRARDNEILRRKVMAKVDAFDETKAKEMKDQIWGIVRKNNPSRSDEQLTQYLSKYAHTNAGEFFAEVFANAIGGLHNVFGLALLEFLERMW
jgi:hypothetical protein